MNDSASLLILRANLFAQGVVLKALVSTHQNPAQLNAALNHHADAFLTGLMQHDEADERVLDLVSMALADFRSQVRGKA